MVFVELPFWQRGILGFYFCLQALLDHFRPGMRLFQQLGVYLLFETVLYRFSCIEVYLKMNGTHLI